MADTAAHLRFVPQIYAASQAGAGLRRLRIRFSCINFRLAIATAVGERALSRVSRHLLSDICGFAGFCVRSTLP
jgi:hypothetical protein